MNLRHLWAPVFASCLLSVTVGGWAQTRVARLPSTLDGSSRTALAHSGASEALVASDAGALPANTKIGGITLVFNRSAAQEADLQTSLAAQANPASPLYHQWLTPDAFAARFGMADADIATAESWLQAQGFTIDGVARSRDRINFTGTAAQVAQAFGTELHRYNAGGKVHFAPSTDVTLPAALASTVSAVLHLSDFRPKPPVKVLLNHAVKPAFTQASTQDHYLTPGDVATQYDVKPVYGQGFNGAGQSIALVGQSYIDTGVIQRFQTASGVSAKAPSLVLVPNTGVSGYDGDGYGDEGESELDVEYASGMAPGANIFFVYVGDASNYSIADSVAYAITEGVAPVISVSYGICEIDSQSGTILSAGLAEQATAQGQTIVVASGDQGSTSCFGDTDLSGTQQAALAVDNPADLANVTAVGGTQMAAGTFTAGNSTYFSNATGSDVANTLLSYVPEVVWNEDSATYGLLSSGGGVSAIIARPSYQAGVPGIPAGTTRLVPDISLQASAGSPGYLVCTSDPFLGGDSTACASGFEDTSTNSVNVVGGTSFAAPIFAGLVTVLNQATHSTGQGNINTVLYSLAANATTYASAFHDITGGSNACNAGTKYCSAAGESGYSATTGYDLATGLGSIDFANLVKAWPVAQSTTGQVASTTTLAAATLTPASAATDAITITVAAGTSGITPTGTVEVVVDGTVASQSLALSNGQATYTYPGTTTGGSHTILVIYSGDTNYFSSSSSIVLTLAGSTLPTGSFTVAAANTTVPANGVAYVNVSVVPAAGYTGVVLFSVTDATVNVCYAPAFVSAGPGQTTGNQATGQMEIGVGSACSSSAARKAGMKLFKTTKAVTMANGSPTAPGRRWPAGIAFAGLLVTGCLFRKRSGRLPLIFTVALLSVFGFGLSGCGSSSSPVTTPTTPISNGPYTVTVTGNDSITTSNSATTTFTLTIAQ